MPANRCSIEATRRPVIMPRGTITFGRIADRLPISKDVRNSSARHGRRIT